MPIHDELQLQAPQRCYLFPTNPKIVAVNGRARPSQQQALFFQYWPQSLVDDYQVEYAEYPIPGGSHPIYQWVGGRGRTFSFEAVFTSELNTLRTEGGGSLTGTRATAAAIASSLVPSSDFTVDVSAALSKIRAWMRPSYSPGGRLGETNPPEILTLAFPNTKLGGTTSLSQVILRAAPITIESWFPNGQPRVATVALTFSEIVQSPGSGDKAAVQIKFIGRDDFETEGNRYRFRGIADQPYIGG